MRARTVLLAFLALLVPGAAGYIAFAWRPAMQPLAQGTRQAFAPAVVKRGRELALIANCNSCHTRKGGEPYAGGVRLDTPFGAIYGTNITPDAETGIGRWSEAAFSRAMHEGVDADGRHLYPAFPYDHFTKVSDQDVRAIYAFLMSVKPVRAEAPANELGFPFNIRPLLAGWKFLFFRAGRFVPDPVNTEDFNRGAYLAEGLAHCGGCHTPRNAFGAEQKQNAFNGGQASGWHAPALNGNSLSPLPWSADQLYTYLRDGFVEPHGVAAGPMREVVTNLGSVPEADVRALAVYTAASLSPAVPRQTERAAELRARLGRQQTLLWQTAGGAGGNSEPISGAQLYAGACALCHERSGLRFSARGIPLPLSKVINLPDPSNLLHIVLHGIEAPPRARFAVMPAFANALTDRQIASVAAYLRATYTDRPAWQDLESAVGRVRSVGDR